MHEESTNITQEQSRSETNSESNQSIDPNTQELNIPSSSKNSFAIDKKTLDSSSHTNSITIDSESSSEKLHSNMHALPNISNNLFIDLRVPITGASNEQVNRMVTRRQLAQNSQLDPELTSEIQRLREHRNPSTHPTALTCDTSMGEPKGYKQALTIPYWYNAMKEELQALYSNKTWTLVPSPVHTNVIGSKWVFKTKLKEDGTLDQYTARLVV